MFCDISWHPIYLIFTNEAPQLLYYSHIPASVISLIIGLFVYKNNKNLVSKILLTIAVLFTLWSIFSLFIWVNDLSNIMSFIWSFFGVLTALLFLSSIYFTHVYITKKDVSIWTKSVWLLLLLPLIIFIKYSAPEFDLAYCEVVENSYYTYYYYLIGLISFIWIISFSVFSFFKTKEVSERKQITYLTIGISAFLVFFSISGFFASYIGNFELEQYGLFGMVVFMAYLAFLIVRFKAFDIKLIGAQALVWALVILVGSQFLFIQTNINRVLTAITLVLSAIMGMIIVRGVKKEIIQRKHIEKIAGELKIANEGQENLIHVMNHQIKGFFGIARNIFAELLQTDDYGKMPEEAKPLLEKGLESTSSGVDYVQEILKGSSATKGVLQYDMKPIDIKTLVSDLLVDQKGIAEKKSLSFTSEISLGDFNTIGDKTHLREAFKNLITNAIKYNDYNDPNRGIKIFLTEKSHKIIFSVSDTGIGIAEEDKARLFTAGGKGKNSTKYNVESSGFGLAFVKGVALAHKGDVGFKSNAPEKGTTFFIELPIQKVIVNKTN
jgi:signal transduction histidine kinase